MGSTSWGLSTSKPKLLAYALFSAPYSFVVFLLPFYIFELGGDKAAVGISFAMYALAIVVFRPAAGWLADAVGRRVTNIAGGVALAVAMAILGISTEVWHIYSALFLAGVGSSLINVATIAYVSDVGGLENPMLYSKMRIAAALGAVGGGLSIPAAYVLSKVWGYAAAFKALAVAMSFTSVVALVLVPGETAHLALRHKSGDVAAAFCITAMGLFIGAATGVYGPQILPYIYAKFSLSPFAAVLVYLPAVVAWLIGPKLARPTALSAITGSALMSAALVAMYHSPNPALFSATWLAESLGFAIASTSLDQALSRHVKGAYWGRGYGVYQSVYNMGYALGAAASGFLTNPFYTALLPLIALFALAAICQSSRRIYPTGSPAPRPGLG